MRLSSEVNWGEWWWIVSGTELLDLKPEPAEQESVKKKKEKKKEKEQRELGGGET